ncbi:hypothetical protein BYT27DRAFT_7340253 [Phlegmacium glaucopus]|nr:hypothetical protein BYT27DRAFT_7340253 [Phlegmacium glaucopus]
MVGLFVTALVGVYTIEDIWEKFEDAKIPIRDQAKHWGAQIKCLIIVPILVFMASFKIHFLLLNHTGPGDAQMSPLFQANLEGNDFAKNPLEVAYGSKLTLKNMGWGGGLLHSRPNDDNNKFTILPRWDEPLYNPNDAMRFLKNGDVIRLNHVSTTRTLHSHTVLAPKIEVVDDINRGTNIDRIHSLTTRLRIKHEALGCYLCAANAVLPQWGFEQIESSPLFSLTPPPHLKAATNNDDYGWCCAPSVVVKRTDVQRGNVTVPPHQNAGNDDHRSPSVVVKEVIYFHPHHLFSVNASRFQRTPPFPSNTTRFQSVPPFFNQHHPFSANTARFQPTPG